MFFRKYQIIVLDQKQETQRTFSMRAIWILLLCVLLVVLALGNYSFWQYYKATQHLPQELAQADEQIASQRSQILALAVKAQHIEDDLARVQKFDASLRRMLDVKSAVPTVLNLGSVKEGDDVGGDSHTANGLAPNNQPYDQPYDQTDSLAGNEASSPHGPSSKHPLLFDALDATSLGLATLPLHRQELLARKIHAYLNDIATATVLEEIHQQELIVAIREQQDILESIPSIWPTKGKLNSRFGWRSSPTSGASTFHKGIDIGKNNGEPIVAPANGTVTFVGRQSGYGNCVEIRHANGISTMYAHMKSYTVKRGQEVKRSDVIGYVGNTGRSTGPHLHYEVRVNGVPVDPMKYILN